jgi:ABC-type sugar transport system permease subunit
MIFPLIYSFYLSITDYHFIYKRSPDIIGFQNYIALFQDSTFLIALKNTVAFSFIFVPIVVFGALFIAILLDNNKWWTTFFRSAVFLPVIVSLALSAVMFRWILSGRLGIFNHILNMLNLNIFAHDWLGDPDITLLSIVIVSLWKLMGLPILLFLGGLGAIDKDIYEAAEVDGANIFQKTFFITLPNLKGTFTVVGIWTIIQSFKVYEVPAILTEGGPGTSSLVLYLYFWRTSFSFYKMGYGAAIAIFLGFIIIALSLVNMYLFRSERDFD